MSQLTCFIALRWLSFCSDWRQLLLVAGWLLRNVNNKRMWNVLKSIWPMLMVRMEMKRMDKLWIIVSLRNFNVCFVWEVQFHGKPIWSTYFRTMKRNYDTNNRKACPIAKLERTEAIFEVKVPLMTIMKGWLADGRVIFTSIDFDEL